MANHNLPTRAEPHSHRNHKEDSRHVIQEGRNNGGKYAQKESEVPEIASGQLVSLDGKPLEHSWYTNTKTKRKE